MSDENILKLFRKINRGISPETIQILTGMHPRDISEKLKSLEKSKIIITTTEKRVRFYKLNKFIY